MKKEFLEFLDNLMAAAPNETAKFMNDDAKTYIEALRASSAEEKEKPEITDNGKLVLGYMQTSGITGLTSKRISENILVSSRMKNSIKKLEKTIIFDGKDRDNLRNVVDKLEEQNVVTKNKIDDLLKEISLIQIIIQIIYYMFLWEIIM